LLRRAAEGLPRWLPRLISRLPNCCAKLWPRLADERQRALTEATGREYFERGITEKRHPGIA
jgi:hypothetical protein